MELSYCIVNTNGRDYLLECLESIRETHPAGVEHEIVVLNNAVDDGSLKAVRERFPQVRLFTRDDRAGASENNSFVLREARGRFCMLLDEDAVLLEGCMEALLNAVRSDPRTAVAGAQLFYPDGRGIGCAWRMPGIGTALAEALFLTRWLAVQTSKTTREAGWVQSAAMLVRRDAAEQVGFYDESFFLYYDEVDLQKKLHDAGWRVLHVPDARAIHNQQISTDRAVGARRVVELHRMHDKYLRKHHSATVAMVVRPLVAWKYARRAAIARVIPGREVGDFWLNAKQALRPHRGEGMHERAVEFNEERGAQVGPRSVQEPVSEAAGST
ncbi:MAG: glycosyltransferase family 2 protein [Solirubrobacterales bacterium]